MQGRVGNATAFRCVLAPEERLASIQPWQWVFLAVEGWELDAGARVEARVIVAVVVEVPAEQWGRLAERRRARRGGEVVLQRRFLLAAVRFLQAGDGEAQGGDLVRALERCRLESGDLVRQAIELLDQRKQGFEGGGLRGELGDLGGEVGESGEHLVDGRLQGVLLAGIRHGHGTRDS